MAWVLRSKLSLIFSSILILIFIIHYTIYYVPYKVRIHVVSDTAAGDTIRELHNTTRLWQSPSLDKVQSKYAFATFLGGDPNDRYLIATRMLAYQLLYAPETRSSDAAIPLIVVVTKNVTEDRIERLQKDGAIVIPVDLINKDWVKPLVPKWGDVLTKLRVWEFTQFERICFLDSDTVLTKPLDGIFEDAAVDTLDSRHDEKQIILDEAEIPVNYSFAGVPELKREHHFPPNDTNGDYYNSNYLNAGFFVLKPSLKMFDYYMSLLNTVNKFDPKFPEQNLLNYAHRRDGNMPWLQLNSTWNIHYPTKNDLDAGAQSLHEKWWSPEQKDLKPYLESWRWRMEGYFEARDRFLDG
jgi:alpha-N-acetylglucosamine transferase